MNSLFSFPMQVRVAAAGVLTAASLAAPAQTLQKIDPAKSEITFVSRQMGVPVQGRFERFDAQLDFDPRRPEAGKVAMTIEVGSATMGVPESDAELPKSPWFNAAKFPKARFVSSSVKVLGDGRYQAAGKLTIKGNQRDLVVPFQLKPVGAASEATGTFLIQRLDFKIGEGEWTDTSMVANDVQIRFKFTLVR